MLKRSQQVALGGIAVIGLLGGLLSWRLTNGGPNDEARQARDRIVQDPLFAEMPKGSSRYKEVQGMAVKSVRQDATLPIVLTTAERRFSVEPSPTRESLLAEWLPIAKSGKWVLTEACDRSNDGGAYSIYISFLRSVTETTYDSASVGVRANEPNRVILGIEHSTSKQSPGQVPIDQETEIQTGRTC